MMMMMMVTLFSFVHSLFFHFIHQQMMTLLNFFFLGPITITISSLGLGYLDMATEKKPNNDD